MDSSRKLSLSHIPIPILAGLVAVAAGMPLAAQPTGNPATADEDAVAALRAELAGLRREYEAKLADLEARLAALEGRAEEPTPPPAGELADLRAAAREAAGAAPGIAAGQPPEVPAEAPGGRLNLNRLNPEISFTGDVLAVAASRDREEFQAREFELDLQAALDPFSRTRWTLAFGAEGEVEVEEGYATYTGLPGGVGLSLGRFRQQFGALNRQHLHALPQSDYPLALRTFFGDEGLGQTGISARWLLPRPWATANELTLELTDGENEAFGGESFEDFAGLVHIKNYWDLSAATYFELGLTGTAGKTSDGRSRRIWGADVTLHWQPPARAKYREITWRTELLLSDLDATGEGGGEAWGGYSYLEGLLARNLYAGARIDWVEDPFEPERRTWGLVPYVTWWQSEFVRLRGELRHVVEKESDRSDDQLLLQLTWAAGPHKHESY